MREKQAIINQIISMEWKMFQNVHNIGGKASCQNQPEVFQRMRKGQYFALSEDVCEHILGDIEVAEKVGRNLVMEKYARMMSSTNPEYYRKIKNFLPKLKEEVKELARTIAFMVAEQSAELRNKYPLTISHNRPVYTEEDTESLVSIETYFKCELMTYSKETLELLLRYTNELSEQGLSLGRELMEETIKQSGYSSLEEAEIKLKTKGGKII